jgi:ABC-type enterochelin transport system permease subunit
MKKNLNKIILAGIILGQLIPLASVFAQVYTQPVNPPQAKGLSGWMETLNEILKWVYTIVLVLSVVMGLYAAFLYVTAGGEQAKVKKASGVLMYAVIGIVIAVLAFSITKIVGSLIPINA